VFRCLRCVILPEEWPARNSFFFFFQWLFFHAQLLDSLFQGVQVSDLPKPSLTRPIVILLGFIAVSAFFLGIFLCIRKLGRITFSYYKAFFQSLNVQRLFICYLAIDVGLLFAGGIIWFVPGLVQPLFVLTLFKWSIFYLLVSAVLIQKRMRGPLLVLICFDILTGFFSYFSMFKEVIYFSFLSLWVFFIRSSIFTKLAGVCLIVLTFYAGVIWTAVKVPYRDFLNKGTGAQAVLVSSGEAYEKLVDLALNVNSIQMDKALEELVDRLSWIGAFDGVYKYVPRKRPHEEGKLWSGAIVRPFMPRLFFPNKKALEDSKELNYYSGLNVDEEHTSISLSMIAGSYVDFGAVWMHVPLFLFGIVCGLILRKAFQWAPYVPIGFALTMPSIYLFHIAEESMNRIVSFIVLYFLLLWFIKTFLLKRFLNFIMT
jgi:hypothetical protein